MLDELLRYTTLLQPHCQTFGRNSLVATNQSSASVARLGKRSVSISHLPTLFVNQGPMIRLQLEHPSSPVLPCRLLRF